MSNTAKSTPDNNQIQWSKNRIHVSKHDTVNVVELMRECWISCNALQRISIVHLLPLFELLLTDFCLVDIGHGSAWYRLY